jgi:hypothetical protein
MSSLHHLSSPFRIQRQFMKRFTHGAPVSRFDGRNGQNAVGGRGESDYGFETNRLWRDSSTWLRTLPARSTNRNRNHHWNFRLRGASWGGAGTKTVGTRGQLKRFRDFTISAIPPERPA